MADAARSSSPSGDKVASDKGAARVPRPSDKGVAPSMNASNTRQHHLMALGQQPKSGPAGGSKTRA